jgi:UDP-N-acetylglucosamine 4-epimerase
MRILITGGAGFIGSNLVESFLENDNVSFVRVLDNLATGHLRNIEEFRNNSKFEFMEGDIRNLDTCIKACKGMDGISHQAALGSVPRSIKDPLTSHDVNVNGFVNILEAARNNNISRLVYASSSSVYGDLKDSPKIETKVGKVLSPYAATKMSNELYAEAYAKNFNMSIVGLRYFNVFGPKQDPNGPYAAVIPLFVNCAIKGESPIINGDGSITRDFTPVENVVQVNALSLLNKLEFGKHEVINVACGQTTSLKKLWDLISEISGIKIEPKFGPERKGDILFSLAQITKMKDLLSFVPEKDIYKSLESTVNYYKKHEH